MTMALFSFIDEKTEVHMRIVLGSSCTANKQWGQGVKSGLSNAAAHVFPLPWCFSTYMSGILFLSWHYFLFSLRDLNKLLFPRSLVPLSSKVYHLLLSGPKIEFREYLKIIMSSLLFHVSMVFSKDYCCHKMGILMDSPWRLYSQGSGGDLAMWLGTQTLALGIALGKEFSMCTKATL